MKESDLHEPVSQWLRAQGYSVHAEVKDCDLVARKDEEMVVVEFKTTVSLTLIYQCLERQERCDAVYLALPVQGSRGQPARLSSLRLLCRRLGLGIILVRFLRSSTRIETVAHPGEMPPRVRHGRRESMIREIDSRYAEFTRGGISSRERHLSAFRQQSLVLARLLEIHGPSSPAALVRMGAGKGAGGILSRNILGWFDHPSRGMYALHPAGRTALDGWRDELAVLERALTPEVAKS